MTTNNKIYLKNLLQSAKHGTAITVSWLESIGISRNLQQYYVKNNWLKPIGRGAYNCFNDKIEWYGGLYSIQKQQKVHVGAISALQLQGLSHYLRLQEENIYLFTQYKSTIPKWFLTYNWGVTIAVEQTSLFSNDSGIIEFYEHEIPIQIASPERAIMECLYLAPTNIDLIECYHLMEGLINLKPKLIQELLISCNSMKVKRLFLYLAEKANHQWLNFIDLSQIDIGKGNREITQNGKFIQKYLISIPQELVNL